MRTRCYPSDLTDAQWALVAPHIPAAKYRPVLRSRGASKCIMLPLGEPVPGAQTEGVDRVRHCWIPYYESSQSRVSRNGTGIAP